MRNELQLQRSESTRLLDARKQQLAEVVGGLPGIKADLGALEREYARQSVTWNTAVESEIEVLARKLGETEQRIRQMFDFQRLGNVVLGLQKRRDDLGGRLEALRGEIERLAFAQEKRKERAKFLVAEEFLQLLRRDLPRQQEFIAAAECDWSFGDNRATVNGQRSFSESSMVILRHSFHLAVLFASVREAFFRVPRFLVLDGIDDGGLEVSRNHNFQRLIVDISRSIENDHQIVFATSQIDPSLERPDLVVGRSYTPDRKALEIR
jgi:hypothetical protein